MQNLHRPVSNGGQWRDTLTIYADGLPDPSQTVFVFTAWSRDNPPRCRESYGHLGARGGQLQASTDDETGRLVAVVNGNSVAVTWLFPASQMQNAPAGSYEASISALIGDELAEIQTVRFVIQERGGPLVSRIPSTPAPLPPPTAILTADAVASLLPLLPTTLPAQPGIPWNNGGFLSWS